jgi:5-methylcytosine-specific restriction endonuclease McrBC GTP-binding regulatory subunit McrB
MSYKYNPLTDTVDLMKSSQNLYDFFDSRDLFYCQEVLSRYYLSLKTKPFVILSGISGTGKTKIAQLFAEYICQTEEEKGKKKRIAFISVRPDWTDNRGLLGYYNVLDERYHTTRLLELLLDASGEPAKPFFVILDEMNLAKVEHYFSDFLSILESRTSNNPKGEAIPLHPLKKVHAVNGREIPKEIYVPANVFFSGTVNVDESTYMFSPKVLDRANVIEFNEVDLRAYAGESVSQQKNFSLLNGNALEKFFALSDISEFCSKSDYLDLNSDARQYVNDISDILKQYNLHFGYRVANELGRFVNLALQEVDKSCLDDAFDIQVLQKILPKMHGTRAKLEEPMQQVLGFCHGEDTSFSEDLVETASAKPETFRFPRSAHKIARMLKQLSVQGYAGFIE